MSFCLFPAIKPFHTSIHIASTIKMSPDGWVLSKGFILYLYMFILLEFVGSNVYMHNKAKTKKQSAWMFLCKQTFLFHKSHSEICVCGSRPPVRTAYIVRSMSSTSSVKTAVYTTERFSHCFRPWHDCFHLKMQIIYWCFWFMLWWTVCVTVTLLPPNLSVLTTA